MVSTALAPETTLPGAKLAEAVIAVCACACGAIKTAATTANALSKNLSLTLV